jgi:phenylalanyl-tRNA synthetase beta chain
MKISYKWILDLLPGSGAFIHLIDTPEKMGAILTSVGLEVEGIHHFEEIPNSLEGLVVGEVASCEKHPDADKLKVAEVNVGSSDLKKIVCGAPNIAKGQKVIVALPGTTISPIGAEPFTIKDTKIRGVKSAGMICAEDEVGLENSHEGIMILPDHLVPGTNISEHFKPYDDFVFDIGLTPNRMSAMSHAGVAKDLCAYLSHHTKTAVVPEIKLNTEIGITDETFPISVTVIDSEACHRYAGITISGIKVESSPKWIQNKLKAVGVRPINNIVDITNYVLQETGQPLHAFDADKIKDAAIHVRFLPEGTSFISLDEKEQKLDRADLMICNGRDEPMCIGGVFGGIDSGVSENTTNIFLESAWFHPTYIRNTSLKHNLRTDAATHFEKGVDISNTREVLIKVATLIKEIAGGEFASGIVDEYPSPHQPQKLEVSFAYINKLSGKNYLPQQVIGILQSLNFKVIEQHKEALILEVPLSNPDIKLPADIVEEVMRIDGLDNIQISVSSNIAVVKQEDIFQEAIKEKLGNWLTGQGFSEIFTNSITRSQYYKEEEIDGAIRLINSINEELDIMRSKMLYTGLESIAYNLNRKIGDVLFFEFGKIYELAESGFTEKEVLGIYVTGNTIISSWNRSEEKSSIYFLKGLCAGISSIFGTGAIDITLEEGCNFSEYFTLKNKEIKLGYGGKVANQVLQKFSIKQPVYFISLAWTHLVAQSQGQNISFKEVAKYPYVNRDLSMVVDKNVSYQSIQDSINSLGLRKLTDYHLFDIFESDKLGASKKSLAINFTFEDNLKTLTDEETAKMMNKIVEILSKNIHAEIRMQADHENA